MDIILDNFFWMALNLGLALIAVIAGFLFLGIRNIFLKILFFFIWLIFMPNTIYIFTDLLHIPDQWIRLNWFGKIVLIGQFAVLEAFGFITYIIAFIPFEKMLENLKFKKYEIIISIVLFNFLIGFGVVLGRIQRLNSWEIFTDTEKVISDSLEVFSSIEMLLITLFFAILGDFVYFLMKEEITVKLNKFLKKDKILT